MCQPEAEGQDAALTQSQEGARRVPELPLRAVGGPGELQEMPQIVQPTGHFFPFQSWQVVVAAEEGRPDPFLCRQQKGKRD